MSLFSRKLTLNSIQEHILTLFSWCWNSPSSKSPTNLVENCFLFRCGRDDGKKDCLPWWFGNECKAHCIHHDDDDNGHYNCAPDGSKTCLDGWFGENCTVFCFPRDDEQGHYTCDKEGNKVCLDGYRPPECINCLLGRYGANCSFTCLGNDTSTFQQGYYYCTKDGAKNCNRWWYGPTCLQYCVPHDDSMHGHYTCDARDGSKVCRPGWEGPSCLDPKQKWTAVRMRMLQTIMATTSLILHSINFQKSYISLES